MLDRIAFHDPPRTNSKGETMGWGRGGGSETACKHQNDGGSSMTACMKQPVRIYTLHCGGSGALRKCVRTSHTLIRTKVFRARGNSAALPRYTYGQVEPLVLLNLITSEDRYFRVSFPGNRPWDSAASAYFICVCESTPILPPSLVPFVCSYPVITPFCFVFFRCHSL